MRETLILQDIVEKLRNPDVRGDFESGSNGAVKLDPEELALVDKLISEGFVSLDEAHSEDSFAAHAHRAADHWISTVDGKPKQFCGGITYERVRRVMRSIQDSGYFQRRFAAPNDQPAPVGEVEVQETAEERSGGGAQEKEFTTDPTSNQQPLSTELATATPNHQTAIPVLQVIGAKPVEAPEAGQVFVNSFAQPQSAPHQQPQPAFLPPASLVRGGGDPIAPLPEELQLGAFTFLQDSELEEQQQQHALLPGGLTLQDNAMPMPNRHLSPIPQQQTIPTQPPGNLVLLNPMISMTGIPPSQTHQLVNGNGIGGGVSPPLFSFPIQNPSVGSMPGPLPQQQQQQLNPVQQLVKTLNVANYNHHQLPAAPIMLHAMSGNQQCVVTQNQMPQGNVSAQIVPSTGAGSATTAAVTVPAENGGENARPAAAAPPHHVGDQQRKSPIANSSTEPMTISEWDPVGQKDHEEEPNSGQQRENSTGSSAGGGRRRDDRRSRGGRQNGNESGYNGSRRRYTTDRSNNNGNGGANYNGPRMQRNGNGPAVEGESGASFRQGGKPHHFNRLSNGGGGGGGGSGSNGGASNGTFYRNNDPNYYNQNGMKSSRNSQPGHQGGYHQQRQSPTAARN